MSESPLLVLRSPITTPGCLQYRACHKLIAERQETQRIDSQVQRLEARLLSQQEQMHLTHHSHIEQAPDPELGYASAATSRCSRCCAIALRGEQ